MYLCGGQRTTPSDFPYFLGTTLTVRKPEAMSLLGLELTDSPVLANHVERLTGSHLPPALCKWSAEGKAVTRCVTGRTAVPCGRRNFTSGVCVKLYRDSSWELNNKI